MSKFEGKVIAITGAASGIGLATACLLAEQGASLSLADFNAAGLEDLKGRLQPAGETSSRHTWTVLDVSSSAAVNEWIQTTIATYGRLDGAANVAGVHRSNETPTRNVSDDDFNAIMNVNVKGVFNCVRAQLNVVQRGASIVNIASTSAIAGVENMSVYSASKHAVLGLTRSVAREEGKRGIRVNCVAPGTTGTSMLAHLPQEVMDQLTASQCLTRFADPKEIANVVAFLLSDEASFVTGACYMADGGMTC